MQDDLVRLIVTVAINMIESDYNGQVPEDPEELEELASDAYQAIRLGLGKADRPMHAEVWAEMAVAVAILRAGKGWPNF